MARPTTDCEAVGRTARPGSGVRRAGRPERGAPRREARRADLKRPSPERPPGGAGQSKGPAGAAARAGGGRWQGNPRESTFETVIQDQTAGLYLTSPSGESFTHPLFLFATCFAVKPCPTPSELPLVGGRSVEVWISPDPLRQYHSPYDYTGGNPINLVDPDGLAAGSFARIAHRVGSKLIPGRHLGSINDAQKALSKNQDVMFSTAQDRDRVLRNLGQGEKGMMHRQGHTLPDGTQGASHGHVAGHPEGFGHGFIGGFASKALAVFGAIGTLLTLTDPLVYAAEAGSPEFANEFSWSRHYQAVDTNPFVVDLLSD